MAARCPHCDVVLTEEESLARKCPLCGKRLGTPTPLAAAIPGRPAPSQAPRQNLAFWKLFGILFVGGVAFAIIAAAATGFQSGGSVGTGMGVALTYGILQGMGLVGNKK